MTMLRLTGTLFPPPCLYEAVKLGHRRQIVTHHAGLVLRDKSQTTQQQVRAPEDNSMAGTSAQDMSGAMTSFVMFHEFPWLNGIVLQGAHIEEEV
jgi:hypothetical protein